MDWKRNFLESSLLRRSTNKNNPNEVQAKCVDLAYKDMMTAGRYYSALFLHTREKICRDTNIKSLKTYRYLNVIFINFWARPYPVTYLFPLPIISFISLQNSNEVFCIKSLEKT